VKHKVHQVHNAVSKSVMNKHTVQTDKYSKNVEDNKQ